MVTIRIEFIISLGLIGAYYLYLIISRILSQRKLKQAAISQESLQSIQGDQISPEVTLDNSNAAKLTGEEHQETLNDHFQKKEISSLQEQIAQVENIISEPEFSTPIAPTSQAEEEQLISEGERLYSEFNEELFDATPRTTSETMIDLQNLMETISSLEALDLTHYHPDQEKTYDMGVGMFYDSISQKLQKIIKEQEFKKLPFLQAEKLECYAFKKIKSLTHDNFRETLKIMKEVGTIKEIILINENIILLNFSKEPLKLNVPEKVVLFFMANHFPTTFQNIQQFTLWKPYYLNEILEGMANKDYIVIEEQNVTCPGLINAEELHELNEHFENLEKKKREKELKAAKLAEEKKKFEQSLKEKRKKKEEQRLRDQQEKLLQEARLKAEKETQKMRAEAEKISEQEEKERLEKIKSVPRPKIQELPNKPKETDEGKIKPTPPSPIVNHDYDEKVQIVEKVLQNFKPTTGGLIVFEALKYYSQQEGMADLSAEEWGKLIQELKNRLIFVYDIEQSGVHAYIYEKLELSEEDVQLIQKFILQGEMNYQEMEQQLGWNIAKIEPFIKHLYEINLIKYNQREKFYFPGLFNVS